MTNPRPQLFGMLAGLFLAAGLVMSSMLATTTWLKVKNSQFITVKGSARKHVDSDLVVWRGTFVAEAPALLEAHRQLQAHQALVKEFLRDNGVTNATFNPVVIEELKAEKNAGGLKQDETIGYRLSQMVRVESDDLNRIDNLDTSKLVEKGVMFTSEAPQYIYTKVGEEKIEMLADATKDARARADQIAAQGQRTIARLHDADMGVSQITARNVTRTSWEGESDNTSRQKTITAVVTATFSLN